MENCNNINSILKAQQTVGLGLRPVLQRTLRSRMCLPDNCPRVRLWSTSNYIFVCNGYKPYSRSIAKHITWYSTSHIPRLSANNMTWFSKNHIIWSDVDHISWSIVDHISWSCGDHNSWSCGDHISWSRSYHLWRL